MKHALWKTKNRGKLTLWVEGGKPVKIINKY
jgi:hypothetical protein